MYIVSSSGALTRRTVENGVIDSPLPVTGEWSKRCLRPKRCCPDEFRFVGFNLSLFDAILVSSVVIFPFQLASNLSVLGSHQRNTASEDRITQLCHLSHRYREGTRTGQGPNIVRLRI